MKSLMKVPLNHSGRYTSIYTENGCQVFIPLENDDRALAISSAINFLDYITGGELSDRYVDLITEQSNL